MDAMYTAEGTAWGGREGRSASSDGVLNLELRIPGDGWPGRAVDVPEQLFAVGYASCFHSALKFVAAKAKVDVDESAVTATVGIGLDGRGGFGLEVALEAELPGVERSVAEDLVAKAQSLADGEHDEGQHRRVADRGLIGHPIGCCGSAAGYELANPGRRHVKAAQRAVACEKRVGTMRSTGHVRVLNLIVEAHGRDRTRTPPACLSERGPAATATGDHGVPMSGIQGALCRV